ncbi:MAG: cation-translocating P-type ATPase, partial [Ruminococcaceae bacterium]|nr:cation-translocating P-type ATPase [Oscillospiraceae bacterium]
LGDRKNMVFMGSTVVYGRGQAVIVGTGMDTEMGKIADALSQAQEGKTPLQIKLAGLSKILTYLVIGICFVIFGVQLIRYGVGFNTIISSFMLAISLAVAAIPEGLATVVTIVLSIGVTNMSKRNAIIRKLTAVETLGCTQIICSDKTGTLTQNKMTVVEYDSASLDMIATAMSLCSDAEVDGSGEVTGEPTEAALVKFAYDNGMPKYELVKKAPRIAEAPFDSMRKMMSTIHQTDTVIRQYTKGAPDEILKKCKTIFTKDGIRPLTDDDLKSILAVNKQYADKALRVLACAFCDYDELPSDTSPEAIENELCYIGLVGMIDPVRPEVKSAIDECRMAGIRPIMITGDHIDTAVAIAMEIGIISDKSEAITGSELDKISDEDFEALVENYSVYARVQPEHKTRIVNAWRKKGMVTAMTGDGVNDAPSIKNADIGIGMGITGTDVTKNVADMILADDNFATIVAAAGEGRRIYDNICKSIQFLLASNLSEVLSIFFATLIGFTIFQPVQLLWINLITDCFPALALGMEKAEADLMKRKPRDSKQGIFANGLGFAVFYQGALVTLITLASYFIGHYLETGNFNVHQSSLHGTTMAFLTLAMCEVFHSFNMRSLHGSIFTIKGQNKWLWGAGILSLILSSAVVLIKPLANVFDMVAIGAEEFFIALLLGFSIIPLVEIIKLIQRKCAKKA